MLLRQSGGGTEHAGLRRGGCRGRLGKGKQFARRGTPAPGAAGVRVGGRCRQRMVGICLGWEMVVKWRKDAQVRGSHAGDVTSANSITLSCAVPSPDREERAHLTVRADCNRAVVGALSCQ